MQECLDQPQLGLRFSIRVAYASHKWRSLQACLGGGGREYFQVYFSVSLSCFSPFRLQFWAEQSKIGTTFLFYLERRTLLLVYKGKKWLLLPLRLVLLKIKHKAGNVLVSHVTKIVFTGLVYYISVFMTDKVLIPNMEGTLGEAVFPIFVYKYVKRHNKMSTFQIRTEQ